MYLKHVDYIPLISKSNTITQAVYFCTFVPTEYKRTRQKMQHMPEILKDYANQPSVHTRSARVDLPSWSAERVAFSGLQWRTNGTFMKN